MRAAIRTLLAVLVILLPGSGESRAHGPAASIVLWAWERPEDLRFIEGQPIAVAFLATTLRWQGSVLTESPRRQPLRVAETTPLTAVVRIETDQSAPLDAGQHRVALKRVLAIAESPGVRQVQIDFDAARSQRSSYVALLHAVRSALPEGTRLSMTALASWCVFDRWIDKVDVHADEVVPMVFAMGTGGASLRARLAADGEFRSPKCRDAVGYSTQEPIPSLPSYRRAYWFHDAPWTPDAVRSAIARTPR